MGQRFRNAADSHCSLAILEKRVKMAIDAVDDVAEKKILEGIVTCVSSIVTPWNLFGLFECPRAIEKGLGILKNVLIREQALTEDVEDCIQAILGIQEPTTTTSITRRPPNL